MKDKQWLNSILAALICGAFFLGCEDNDNDEATPPPPSVLGTWSIGSEWWTFNADGTVTGGNNRGHTGSGTYSVNGSTVTWRITWVDHPHAVVDFTGQMSGNTMTIQWHNNYGLGGSFTANRIQAAAARLGVPEDSGEVFSNSSSDRED
jgi:hypothetical protein